MTVRRGPDTRDTVSVGREDTRTQLVGCPSKPPISHDLPEEGGAAVNPAYDIYGLTEEHELLRKSVRDLAEDVIAPRAAEIDRTAEFPRDVYDALKASDMVAIHVPEAYGGAGADKIASCIVVEEV